MGAAGCHMQQAQAPLCMHAGTRRVLKFCPMSLVWLLKVRSGRGLPQNIRGSRFTCNEAGAVCQLPLSGQVQELHQELTVVPGMEVAAVNRQRTTRQACGAGQEQCTHGEHQTTPAAASGAHTRTHTQPAARGLFGCPRTCHCVASWTQKMQSRVTRIEP